jgi:hypothetical protein
MAYVVTTGYTYGTIDAAAHTQVVSLNGNWSRWVDPIGVGCGYYPSMQIPYNGTVYPGSAGGLNTGYGGNYSVSTSGAAYYPPKRALDTTYVFRATVQYTGDGSQKTGGNVTVKTQSIAATASDPSSSAVTSSTATIACASFYPNAVESTVTVWLEYKKSSDSTWTTAGATASSTTGYASDSISRDITGLSGSTTYQFRVRMTRTTVNETSFAGNTVSFATTASAPTVTTDSASGVSSATATLNGTVNPNGISTTYYFEYGLNTGYGTTTAAQGPGAGTSDVPFSQGISGLTASTTYHFRAVAGTGPVNGSDGSFATSADPAAEAILEDHMHHYEYDGQWGVAKTVYFTLQDNATDSSDRLVTTAPASLFDMTGTKDVQISKDGGAFTDITAAAVTQITAAMPYYSVAVSATEMEAEDVLVTIVDQDGPAFRDATIHVRTKIKTGQLAIDATQIGSNTPGITVTGVGTSPGILAIGGATSSGDITGALTHHIQRRGTATAGAAATITLDASANASNDYYNNSIIILVSGPGAGQARVITDYVGSTLVATVNAAWTTQPTNATVFVIVPGEDTWNLPLAELAALPAAGANAGVKVQLLFQRFAFKIDQTSILQQWYKTDSATVLVSRSVSDNGTTQVVGKLA